MYFTTFKNLKRILIQLFGKFLVLSYEGKQTLYIRLSNSTATFYPREMKIHPQNDLSTNVTAA